MVLDDHWGASPGSRGEPLSLSPPPTYRIDAVDVMKGFSIVTRAARSHSVDVAYGTNIGIYI